LKDVLEQNVDEKYFLNKKQVRQLIESKHEHTSRVHSIEGNSPTITAKQGGGHEPKIKIVGNTNPSGNGMNGRVFDESGIAQTLSTNKGEGIKIKSATKQGYETATENDSINFSVPNSETRRGRVGKGVAQTLDTQCNQGVYKDYKIRRLTPRECFMLQDFPDTFDFSCVSDSQAYKQAGNSITVRVLEKIIRQFKL
jgi:DNA (cytosine-5)-methyltransferase 1